MKHILLYESFVDKQASKYLKKGDWLLCKKSFGLDKPLKRYGHKGQYQCFLEGELYQITTKYTSGRIEMSSDILPFWSKQNSKKQRTKFSSQLFSPHKSDGYPYIWDYFEYSK